MSSHKKAKNFDAALKYAQSSNLPGGTLQVDVLRCARLPAADASGKCDPSVRMTFSKLSNQQHAATESVTQNLNPTFKSKNKFLFNVVDKQDLLKVEVYDTDLLPYPRKELIAKCTVEVGEDTFLGTDSETTVHLHGPKTSEDNCSGKVPGNCGTATLRVYYDYNETANTHAAVDVTAEDEEFQFGKFKEAISEFSLHMGYMMGPIYYWLDTCMWSRPFESAFWLMFFTVSTFFFENLLSAFFPGLMFILFCRQYLVLMKHGFKGPPEEEYVDVGWKETLRVAQINLSYYNGMFDYWNEIYSWRRRSVALVLTKFFGGWALLVLLFPWFPSFRYWFWMFMVYMYTLYPLYIMYPRLMTYHSTKFSEFSGYLTLRQFELKVKPFLPKSLTAYLPLSEEATIVAHVEAQLPPLPDREMDYVEWKEIHTQREELRHRLELRESGFLDERGHPKCDARKGKLLVKIISASDLVGADASGSSDPYVILKIGNMKQKTQVKSKQLAPVWNEDFIFREVGYLSGVLSMEVYDKNRFSADDSLGTCQVKLETVIRGVDRMLEVPLAGTSPDAKIAISLKGEGLAWPRERDSNILQLLQERRRAAKQSLLNLPPDTRSGTLHVKLCYGSGLKVCDARASDPYATLFVTGPTPHSSANAPHKSRTIDSTLAPVWNENFKFESVTGAHALQVRVFDKDKWGKDDFMGEGSVLLRGLFESEKEEEEIKLMEKGKQYGFVVVSLIAKGFGRVLEKTPAQRPVQPAAVAAPALSPQLSTVRARTEAGNGCLTVLVQMARSLCSTRADPAYYVKIKLLTPSEQVLRFKTRPVNPGTQSPIWSVKQAFASLPTDALHTHRLEVEVWDQNGSTPECLATGELLNLPQLLHVKSLEVWVPVLHKGKPGGEVRIGLEGQGFA